MTILNVIANKAKRFYFNFEDWIFEKKYGFDFSGILYPHQLIDGDSESLLHATAYHAVWCSNWRKIHSKLKKRGYSFDVFVDIGSGKGKACIYADLNKFCKESIGVEFSENLVKIADINKERSGSEKVTFINCDALEYRLPPKDCLIFMFNPFDGVILEKFILNNIQHFKQFNSVLAYANDIQRRTLINLNFSEIYRHNSRNLSIYSCEKVSPKFPNKNYE
ncbi:class I SAM-dependent methyltransferase [Polynucleobacter paneuropaeus]|uniref:class I SAM-dependent methyltransferase n=1 Tax=Polynucleobacter paneuropaeus TaxID=2527775 RepID=UPI001BFD4FAD|nr:class I SAM-dependent methyltransferase [Polynucleobacter paneuropaeus]MBT8621884.1 class I SAM-dependent methyltransferase [Polynucleobacter paneuropaeus]